MKLKSFEDREEAVKWWSTIILRIICLVLIVAAVYESVYTSFDLDRETVNITKAQWWQAAIAGGVIMTGRELVNFVALLRNIVLKLAGKKAGVQEPPK